VLAWQARPASLWQFYGNPIVIEFLIGMAIARLRQHVERIPAGLAAALAAAGAVLFVIDPLLVLTHSTFLRFALPAAMLVCAAVALEANGRRAAGWPVLTLGAISYVLYISHPLVLSAFNNVQERIAMLRTPPATLVLAVIAICTALVFAWIVHRWFEQPVANLLRRSRIALKAHSP
jgi:exopolysaccharide production protein ExoZ